MGQEQLLALEEGGADILPEPVFVIAQARRVANSLAIDVNGPLHGLRDCGAFQASPVKVGELTPRPSRGPLGQTGSSGLQTISLIALAGGTLTAMIGGSRSGWQQWQQQLAGQAQPTAATKRAAAQAPSQSSPAAAPNRRPPSVKDNQLLLRSPQPSWLEVKTDTGTTLFRGIFQGERPFPLGGGLVDLAGRPDLVQAQLGTGPAQPLGRIDQVRWHRFKAPAP